MLCRNRCAVEWIDDAPPSFDSQDVIQLNWQHLDPVLAKILDKVRT
jgi:hypothetical protein